MQFKNTFTCNGSSSEGAPSSTLTSLQLPLQEPSSSPVVFTPLIRVINDRWMDLSNECNQTREEILQSGIHHGTAALEYSHEGWGASVGWGID
jgi:hypothetical protein